MPPSAEDASRIELRSMRSIEARGRSTVMLLIVAIDLLGSAIEAVALRRRGESSRRQDVKLAERALRSQSPWSMRSNS